MKTIDQITETDEQIAAICGNYIAKLIREFPQAPELCIRMGIVQAVLRLTHDLGDDLLLDQVSDRVAMVAHQQIVDQLEKQQNTGKNKILARIEKLAKRRKLKLEIVK
jgi:hypothetical protein